MASWAEQDQGGFRDGVTSGVGQITEDSNLGRFCKKYAANEEFKTFLEVGTWNGLGTTKVLFDQMKKRSDYVANEKCGFHFYSLECNKEKATIAAMFYSSEKSIQILNEVLSEPSVDEIKQVFPVINEDQVYKAWMSIDNQNIETASKFLDRKDLPEIFDVVLLDGGEFTTWFDFLAIKNRAKHLLLDDTKSLKCMKVVEHLYKDPEWEVVEDIDEHLGCVVARRKQNELTPPASADIRRELSVSPYTEIPIVIHHEGGSQDYFKNSVRVNAERNRVIVIGDDANQGLFKDLTGKVEHIHVNSLRTKEIEDFEKCYTNYSYMDEKFELKCFLRAFYVKELIRQKGLERVFYVDSDCVILENIDSVFKKLPFVEEGYSIQKHMQRSNRYHQVGCIHNALMTETLCDDFIKLCFDIYKSKDKFSLISDKWEHHKEIEQGGVCDMTVWFLLLQNRRADSVPVTDFNDLFVLDGEDCVFDHNVSDGYGFAGPNTYLMVSEPAVSPWVETKSIMKRNNKYYIMTNDGREVRLLSIHYQGGAKEGLSNNHYQHF